VVVLPRAGYCCLLAFTINTAAYQAEIFARALQSLHPGQAEAAKSLGMRPYAVFLKVEMPQALIIALRPLGNELIVMIKASSLASLVTLFDLMGATKLAFARSFDLSIYFVAALIYLANGRDYPSRLGRDGNAAHAPSRDALTAVSQNTIDRTGVS